jgi:hypothetical protein
MIMKLLASLFIFTIAIVEILWSQKLSQNKIVRRNLFGILFLCLVFSFYTIISDDIQTTAEMKTLTRKNDTLKFQRDSLLKVSNEYRGNPVVDDNEELQSKINELQDKLEPFIKIAIKKYPYLKTEEALTRLQKETRAKHLTHPNTMVYEKKKITQIPGGYSLKLYFTSGKKQILGPIAIRVTILGVSSSKILDIWPSLEGGNFSTGKDSKLIITSGKEARIVYSLTGKGQPVIEIKLSSKGTLHVEGNNELPSFDIKM